MRIVSPMPSASSVPRPTADLSEPDHFVPASVMPRWSGLSIRCDEQAVRRDRVGHVGRLDRHLEVLEVEPVHQLDVLDRGRHERLDRVLALELVQVLGQRAGVHADAHRHAGRAAPSRRPRAAFSWPPMLPGLMRMQCAPASIALSASVWLKWMSAITGIGDSRTIRSQRPHVLVARHRAAHQVPARFRDGVDLLHGRVEVRGLRLGHRLHRDGRPAADLHPADVDLALGGHRPKGI